MHFTPKFCRKSKGFQRGVGFWNSGERRRLPNQGAESEQCGFKRNQGKVGRAVALKMSPEGHQGTKWSKPHILHLNFVEHLMVFRGVSVTGILAKGEAAPRGWVRAVRLKTQSRQSGAVASCSGT